jgi:hypothetical protein
MRNKKNNMNLSELINYFRSGGSYKDFCRDQSLDDASEAVEIYMEQPLELKNNLAFFEIETTEGSLEFVKDGIRYYSLFGFPYFINVLKEIKNLDHHDLTDKDIADILYNDVISKG